MRRHFQIAEEQFQQDKVNHLFIASKQKYFSSQKNHQYNTANERCLSPWVSIDQKKQVIKPQSYTISNHKFLQKIMFRTKKNSINPPISTPKVESRNNNLQQQDNQQNIIVFPKSASSRHQANLSNQLKFDENSILNKTKRQKLMHRPIKPSNIISIDLEMNNKQQLKVNPEKILVKTKNLNPYMKNQKKKEFLKYKIKHNNRLTMYFQKQRQQQLRKYLKIVTENSKKTIQFTPARGLKTAKTVSNRNNICQSVDLDSLICHGQFIQIKDYTQKNRMKKMGLTSPEKTVFLY